MRYGFGWQSGRRRLGRQLTPVPPPDDSSVVASIQIVPANPVLEVGGGSPVLTAIPRNEAGQALLGKTINWTVTPSAGVVNYVEDEANDTLTLTPVAAGTVDITAECEGVSLTLNEVVVDNTPGTPTNTLDVTFARLATGTGPTLVSNGVPLAQGMLNPADIGKVRLLVGGVEQAIYVEALDGRWPDGSVKFILVQWNAGNRANGIFGNGQLAFGTTATVARITKTDPSSFIQRDYDTRDQCGFPAGVVLPTNASYLCSTGLFGLQLMPRTAAVAAAGGLAIDVWARFDQWGDTHWDNWRGAGASTPSTDSVNYVYLHYDRMWSYWRMWAQQGSDAVGIEWFRRACAMAARFIQWQETKTNPYRSVGTQTPYIMPYGGLWHYWFTGDPRSRTFVVQYANNHWVNWLNPPATWMVRTNVRGEARPHARMTDTILAAYLMGDTTYNHAARLDAMIESLLGTNCWVFPEAGKAKYTGCFSGTAAAPGTQSNFQCAMIGYTMASLYDKYRADERLLERVEELCNFLWEDNSFVNSAGQRDIYYYENTSTTECGGAFTNGRGDGQVSLNGFYAPIFAWLYRRTGNTTWRTRAIEIMEALRYNGDGITGVYYTSRKEFNEAIYGWPDGLGLVYG